VFGVGLVLLAFSGIGVLRPVEDASYTLFSPLERLLRSAAEPIADIVANYGDISDLTRENDALRAENERLEAEIARLREEGARQEELERLLETRSAFESETFVTASVIARDPSNLRRRIALDVGREDGVREGMPVITAGTTLVGTISAVEDKHAWVTLVSDVDSAVAALLLESRAEGVLVGSYGRRLQLEFVEQGATVNEGDTVLTSGLNGTYPKDLVIGKVTGVGVNRQELFRSVTVEPLASLSRLETVLVMTSFEPTEVTPP
jgi:rod shape-determining protein MreC